MGNENLNGNSNGNIKFPEISVGPVFERDHLTQHLAIYYVYGDTSGHLNDMKYIMQRMIICHHNINVKKMNDKIVDMFKSR